MSDMSHVYKAYAAVHNSEKRNNLSEVRDEISEMNLKQLTDVDLYEVAEEVLEDIFAGGADIADAKKLIESVFTKASEGDSNPFREDKIDRLAEAFISAFEKVTERSLRTAVESYSEYRINKERLEKWNDSNSTGNVNAKLHEKLVAQDRLIVKNGLKSMIESIGSAIDKTLGAAGEVADTAIKLPAKAVGYAKGLKKGLKKAAKKGEDKASGDASPKNESYEAQKTKEVMGALKKRDLKTSVKKKIAADIVKKKGDTSKSDDRYAYESKLWDEVAENLTELGELGGVKYKVVPLDESDIADILARLEKKRISKGGNPDESPLGKKTGRAMKAQQDKARKKAGLE